MYENDDKIKEIKNKLNSPKYKQKENWRHHLAPQQYSVKDDWDNETVKEDEGPVLLTSMPKENKKMGALGYLFILSLVFFIGAILFAMISFLGGKVGLSSEEISIDVTAPITISSGEKIEFDIVISNNNQIRLDVAELVVEYPSGTRSAEDINVPLTRTRTSLGPISTGDIVKHVETARIFGEENESIVIPMRLEYQIASSNALFKVYKEIDLTLSSAPIRLDVTGLEKVTGGQAVAFDIALESNSKEILNNVIVEVEYPFGFNFINSNIRPIFNSRVWEFEEIQPGETIDIHIDGILEGQNSEDRYFKFSAGLQDPDVREKINVLLATFDHVIEIDNPFLALDLSFGNDDKEVYIMENSDTVVGEIVLENTTQQAITDVEVIVKVNENIFDKSSVKSNQGYFDSLKDTISWNSQLVPDLKVMSPGDMVQMNFQFSVPSFVRANGSIVSKPELTFDVSVAGERVNERGVDESIKTSTFKKIMYSTDVKFVGNTKYNTPSVINYGPIPPRVEQETAYVGYFDILNPSNNITDAVVTATLPQNVKWKNVVYPTGQDIKFNDITRVITWNAGNIPAGAGYVSDSKSIMFQVAVTPSANQVGLSLPLIGQPKFVGYDTHTGTNIERNLESFTTDTEDAGSFDNIKVVN